MIVNRSTLDKEKFSKFNKDMFALRGLFGKWLSFVGIAVGVILVVCGICIENIFVLGLCLGAFMISFFTAILFLPMIVQKNAGKVFEANAKGKAVQNFDYYFDQDLLTVKDGSGHIFAEGEYDNIEQVVETATAFYLLIDTNSCFGFVVDKDGFVEGDANQLADILKNKIEKYVKID